MNQTTSTTLESSTTEKTHRSRRYEHGSARKPSSVPPISNTQHNNSLSPQAPQAGFQAILVDPSSFPEIPAPPYEGPRRDRELTAQYLLDSLSQTPMGIAYKALVNAARETLDEFENNDNMIREFLDDPFDLGLMRFRYFGAEKEQQHQFNSIEECKRRAEQHRHRLQTRKRHILKALSKINYQMQLLEEDFMAGWTRLTRY
jgi:hypothetical protein